MSHIQDLCLPFIKSCPQANLITSRSFVPSYYLSYYLSY